MRTYPFVKAKWFTPGPRNGPIDLIVIHDAEYPEELDGAEAVANYFARTKTKASAHFTCDADSTVQSVRMGDIAYAAPGSNHNGVHIELCGYAKQTTADWLDDYGVRMLRDQAAPLVRDLADEIGIPLTWLNVNDLKAPRPRGVTSHWNVSLAYRKSTHTDPGSGFPIGQFIDWCKNDPPTPPPTEEEEDDMEIINPVDDDGQPDPDALWLRVGDKLTIIKADELADFRAAGLKTRAMGPKAFFLLRNTCDVVGRG